MAMFAENGGDWLVLLAVAPAVALIARGLVKDRKKLLLLADACLLLTAAAAPLMLAYLYYAHSGGPDTPAQILVPAVVYGALFLLGAVWLIRDARRP